MSSRKSKRGQKLGSSRRNKNHNQETEEKDNDDGYQDPGKEEHESECQFLTVSENQSSNKSSLLHPDQPVVVCTSPSSSVLEFSPQPQSQEFNVVLGQADITSKKRKMGSTRKGNRNFKFEEISEDEPEHRVQLSEGFSDEHKVDEEASIKEYGGKEDQTSLMDCLHSQSSESLSSVLQGKHFGPDTIMQNEDDSKNDKYQHLEAAVKSKPIDIFSSEPNQPKEAEFSQDLKHDQSSLNVMVNDTLEGSHAEDIVQDKVTGVQSASLIYEHEHMTEDDKMSTVIWENVNSKASTEDEKTVEHSLEHKDKPLQLTEESIYKSESTEVREDTDEYKEVSAAWDRTDNDSYEGLTETNLNQTMVPDTNIISHLKMKDQELGTSSEQILSDEFQVQGDSEIICYREEKNDLSEARCWTGKSSADEKKGNAKNEVDMHYNEEKYRATGSEGEVEYDDMQSANSNQLLISKVSSTNRFDSVTESELIPAKTLYGATESNSKTCNLQHNNPKEFPTELEMQSKEGDCSDQMPEKVDKDRSEFSDTETEVAGEENNDIKEEINAISTESFTKDDFKRVDDEKDGMSTFMNELEMASVMTNIQDYVITGQASIVIEDHGIESPDKGGTCPYLDSVELIHETQVKLDMPVYNPIPDQKQNMYDECQVYPTNAEQFESTFPIVYMQESRQVQDNSASENVRFSPSKKNKIDSFQRNLSGQISVGDQNAMEETIQVQSLEESTPVSGDETLNFTAESCYHHSPNMIEPEAKKIDENVIKAEHLVDTEVLKMQSRTEVAESITRNEETTWEGDKHDQPISLEDPHQNTYPDLKLEQSKTSECTEIVTDRINTDHTVTFAEPIDTGELEQLLGEKILQATPTPIPSTNSHRRKMGSIRRTLGEKKKEKDKEEDMYVEEKDTAFTKRSMLLGPETGASEENDNDRNKEINAGHRENFTTEAKYTQQYMYSEIPSQTVLSFQTTIKNPSSPTEHTDFQKDDKNNIENLESKNAEIQPQTQTKKKKKIGSTRRPHGRHQPPLEGEEGEWKELENAEEIEHQLITQVATSNLINEPQNTMSEVTPYIHGSTVTTEQIQIITTEGQTGTGGIDAILSIEVDQINTVASHEVGNTEGLTDTIEQKEKSAVHEVKDSVVMHLDEQEMAPVVTKIQDDALIEHVSLTVRMHDNEIPDNECASRANVHSICENVDNSNAEILTQTQPKTKKKIGSTRRPRGRHQPPPEGEEGAWKELENAEEIEHQLITQVATSNLINEPQNTMSEVTPNIHDSTVTTEQIQIITPEGQTGTGGIDAILSIEVDQINTVASHEVGTAGGIDAPPGIQVISDMQMNTENIHTVVPDQDQNITQQQLENLTDWESEQEQPESTNPLLQVQESQSSQVEVIKENEDRQEQKMDQNRTSTWFIEEHNNDTKEEIKAGPTDNFTKEDITSVCSQQYVLCELTSQTSDLGLTTIEYPSPATEHLDFKEDEANSIENVESRSVEIQPQTQTRKKKKIGSTRRPRGRHQPPPEGEEGEWKELENAEEIEHQLITQVATSNLINEPQNTMSEVTPNIHGSTVTTEQIQIITPEGQTGTGGIDAILSIEVDQINTVASHEVGTAGGIDAPPGIQVISDMQLNTENIHTVVPDQDQNITQQQLENLTDWESEQEQPESTNPLLQVQESQSSQVEVIKENENTKEQKVDQNSTNASVIKEHNNDTKEEIKAGPTDNFTKEDITSVCSQQYVLCELTSQTSDLGLTTIEYPSPATEHLDFKEDEANSIENVESRNAEIQPQTQTRKKKKIGSTRRPHGRHQPPPEGEEGEWKELENAEEIEHQLITQVATSNLINEPQNTMSEVTPNIHDSTVTTEQIQIITTEGQTGTGGIDAILSIEVDQINTVASHEVGNTGGIDAPPGIQVISDMQMNTENIHTVVPDQDQNITQQQLENLTDWESEQEQPESTNPLLQVQESQSSQVEVIKENEDRQEQKMDQNRTSTWFIEEHNNDTKEEIKAGPTDNFTKEDITSVCSQQYVLCELTSQTSDLGLTTIEYPSPATEHLDFKEDEANSIENVESRSAEIQPQTQTRKKKKMGSTRRPHGRHQPPPEGEEGEWKELENAEEIEHQLITQVATSNLINEPQNTMSEVTPNIHDSTVTTEQIQIITTEGQTGTGGIDAILSIEVDQINTVASHEVGNTGGIDAPPGIQVISDMQMNTENIHTVVPDQDQNITQQQLENLTDWESEQEQPESTNPLLQVQESQSSQVEVIKENEDRQEQKMDQNRTSTWFIEEHNNDTKEEIKAGPTDNFTKEDITSVCSQQYVLCELTSQTSDLGLTTIEYPSPATEHLDFKEDEANSIENVESRSAEIQPQTQTRKKKKMGSTRRPRGRHQPPPEGEEGEWKELENAEEIEHQLITQVATSNLINEPQNTMSEVTPNIHDSTVTTEQIQIITPEGQTGTGGIDAILSIEVDQINTVASHEVGTAGGIDAPPGIQVISDMQMNTENIHTVVPDQDQNITQQQLENLTDWESEQEQPESTNPLLQVQESQSSQVEVIKENEDRQEQKMDQNRTSTWFIEEHNNDTKEEIKAGPTDNFTKEDITSVCSQQYVLCELTSQTSDLGLTTIEYPSPATEHLDFKEDEANSIENVESRSVEIHPQTQTRKKKKIGSTRRPRGRHQPPPEGEEGEWKELENAEEIEHQLITQVATSNLINEPQNTMSEVTPNIHGSTVTTEQIQIITPEGQTGTGGIDAILSIEVDQINTVASHEVGTAGGIDAPPGIQVISDMQLNTENIHTVVPDQDQNITQQQLENLTDWESEQEQPESTNPLLQVQESQSSQVEVIKENEDRQEQKMDQNRTSTWFIEEHNNDTKEEIKAGPTDNFTKEDITSVCSQQYVLCELTSQTSDMGLTTIEYPSPATEHLDFKEDEANSIENVESRSVEIQPQTQTRKKKKMGSTRRPRGRHQPPPEGEEGEWKELENAEEIEHQLITQVATSNLINEPQNIMSEVTPNIHGSTVTTEQIQIITTEGQTGTGGIEAILSIEVDQINTVASHEVGNTEGLTDTIEQKEKSAVHEVKDSVVMYLDEQEMAPVVTKIQDDALIEHVSLTVRMHDNEIPDNECASRANVHSTCENVDNSNAEIQTQRQHKKKKKFGSTRRPHGGHQPPPEGEEGEWKDLENTEEIQCIDHAASSNLLSELQNAITESLDTHCTENSNASQLAYPTQLIPETQASLDMPVVSEQYHTMFEESLENPKNNESEKEQCDITCPVVHIQELNLAPDYMAKQSSGDSNSGRRKKIGSTRRSLRVIKEKENIQEQTRGESTPKSAKDNGQNGAYHLTAEISHQSIQTHSDPLNIIEHEAEEMGSICKNLEEGQSKQEAWQRSTDMSPRYVGDYDKKYLKLVSNEDMVNPESSSCDKKASVPEYKTKIHHKLDHSEGSLLSEIELYLNKSFENTLNTTVLNPNISEFSEPMFEGSLQLPSSQKPQIHMEQSSPARKRKMGSSRKMPRNKHEEKTPNESEGSEQEKENLDKNSVKNSEPKTEAKLVEEMADMAEGTEDMKESAELMSEVQALSETNESSTQVTEQPLPEGRRKFGSRRTTKGCSGLGAFTHGDYESNQENTDIQMTKDLRVSDPCFISEPKSPPISHQVSEARPGTEEVTKVKNTNISHEAGLVSLDSNRKTSPSVVSTGIRQKIDFEQWNEQIPDFGELVYNIVMVGNSSVGKTSFIKRLQSGHFIPDYSSTIGVDTFVHTVTFGNKTVRLYVWDTAGQERYHSITRQVFHKAQGLLLMYDITSSQSFHAVRAWISQIQENAHPDVILMLLGNKNDCADREVQLQEGETLSKEYDIHFMECSVATGENVSESLKTLAWLLMKQRVRKEEEHKTLQPKPQQNKKSGCC